MPRKIISIDPKFPLHIGARSNNRDWFAIPMVNVWRIMEDQLFFARHAFNLEIHSFVLMSNHFHLIVTAKEGNISSAMNYFMRETSRSIGRESGRINHVYGGHCNKTVIDSNLYFETVYKYVYRNPVEANLCSLVEDYPFSTLRHLIGLQHSVVPLCEDTILMNDFEGTLKWLNRPPLKESQESVRKGLRKKFFSIGSSKGGEAKRSNLLFKSY